MTVKSKQRPNWIAVDWGTTNLRVWIVDENEQIAAHCTSVKNTGMRAPSAFEPALLEVISGYLSEDFITPVLICGMAGAREGWVDAGYLTTPCPPLDARQGVVAPTNDPRMRVRILPGVKQISPPDIMRGEETQIAGFLLKQPEFDGVMCLPGTHTKWVKISAKGIEHFQTFMTGELFTLLSKSSVLSHVIAAKGWHDAAFTEAVSKSLNDPGIPISQLFSLRAEALVGELAPVEARARLSGHLIGAELRACRAFWQGREIVVLGDEIIARAYYKALESQGVDLISVDADPMTLAGLKAAFTWQEDTFR